MKNQGGYMERFKFYDEMPTSWSEKYQTVNIGGVEYSVLAFIFGKYLAVAPVLEQTHPRGVVFVDVGDHIAEAVKILNNKGII